MPVFFPNPEAAWAFLGLLLMALALASALDLRHYVIPKSISLTLLGVGLAVNLVRGFWLGSQGHEVWKLGEAGPAVGALDGLLFALAGAALGFGLFTAMWLLGVCGGGDVKLFTGLGAWIGPYLAILVLAASVPMVLLLSLVQVAASRLAFQAGPIAAGPGRRRVLSFSLPLTLAVALVLLWIFRVELGLAAPAIVN